MNGKTEANQHQLEILLIEPFPREVEAGSKLDISVRLSCSNGCDLNDAQLKIVDSEGCVSTHKLDRSDSTTVIRSRLSAPNQSRVSSWKIQFPEQELAGQMHQEAELILSLKVLPHRTSVAVWNIPSPMLGSNFNVNVGVKCTSECNLGGQLVEIRDESGMKLTEAVVGNNSRPDTEALYEAELSLLAPDEPGVFSRTISFAADHMECEHKTASGTFTFRTLEPPECLITVKVIPTDDGITLSNIDVRVGRYAALTNEEGIVSIEVPTGNFELSALSTEIEPVSISLNVTEDAVVEIQASAKAVVDEDARKWGHS